MGPPEPVEELEAKVAFRCTFKEKEKMQLQANSAGVTLSQYLRRQFLESGKVPPYVRVMLAESLKTQIIVGTVVATAVNGEPMTPSDLEKLGKQADLRKFAMADGLIEWLKEVDE